MRKSLVSFLIVGLISILLVACSSDDERSLDKDYNKYTNENYNTEEIENGTNETEDPLSGIWDVVEGGDSHSIIIANGNIQIIDGSDSEIYKYTKPSNNVFEIEIYGDTIQFKYKDGFLYRYENGENDGYVYERTAYNSNK